MRYKNNICVNFFIGRSNLEKLQHVAIIREIARGNKIIIRNYVENTIRGHLVVGQTRVTRICTILVKRDGDIAS